MCTGFSKLSKNIVDSEVFYNQRALQVYIYLLTKANYQDREFEGVQIKEGQVATSYKSIAKAIGLPVDEGNLDKSRQSIRSTIRVLTRARYCTPKGHRGFLVITITNYLFDDMSNKKGTHLVPDLAPTWPPTKNRREKEKKNNNTVELKPDVACVVSYLNQKTGRAFKIENKDTQQKINSLLKDGHTVEELNRVIDIKCHQWLDHPKMSKFLRPETLFSKSKFEGYLNEPSPEEDHPSGMSREGLLVLKQLQAEEEAYFKAQEDAEHSNK